jgi:hypothetical protein
MIERWAYVNITSGISKIIGEELKYEPTGFNIGHDQLLQKYPRAFFTLQRRAEAPLPTEIHLALLERCEKDVAEMLNPRLLASRS